VAGVLPKAAGHQLPAVRRVPEEPRQLEVPHRLEEEPDEPDQGAEGVERGEGRGRGGVDEDHRRGHKDQKDALQHEDLEEGADRKGASPLLPPLPVPRVLALAPVPEMDVQRQPQSPDRDEAGDQQGARRIFPGGDKGDQRGQDEAEAPGHVRDVVAIPEPGGDEPSRHVEQDCACREKIDPRHGGERGFPGSPATPGNPTIRSLRFPLGKSACRLSISLSSRLNNIHYHNNFPPGAIAHKKNPFTGTFFLAHRFDPEAEPPGARFIQWMCTTRQAFRPQSRDAGKEANRWIDRLSMPPSRAHPRPSRI
jgi:hypothetical protein